jgi:hypothetical protein
MGRPTFHLGGFGLLCGGEAFGKFADLGVFAVLHDDFGGINGTMVMRNHARDEIDIDIDIDIGCQGQGLVGMHLGVGRGKGLRVCRFIASHPIVGVGFGICRELWMFQSGSFMPNI